jgi:hypothetical protein
VFGLRGDFRLGLLSNGGTVETLGILGVGLNAFCILRQARAFGVYGWDIIVCISNVPLRCMC